MNYSYTATTACEIARLRQSTCSVSATVQQCNFLQVQHNIAIKKDMHAGMRLT
jgi:hypothetical protein